ncbi:MAG: C40 family peptidase [Clostridia bacterium]|nr:C40 family peptidase [Clostridia bacterium]
MKNKLIRILALMLIALLIVPVAFAETQVYTNKKTKIYASASTSAKAVCTVTIDYPLYVVGTSGSFYQVKDKEGQFNGYIPKTSTSTKRTAPYEVAASAKTTYSSSGSSTTVPSGVKSSQYYFSSNMTSAKYRAYGAYLAQTKVGCKYSTNPNNTNTFSNQSYVKTIMGYMGYTVPDKANSIGHSGKGAFVARANLLKGDIVCFDCDTTNGLLVDHVGIYIGSGYFVHASPSAGCVVVSRMTSGYYYKAFCWGRRYLDK